MKQVCIDWVVSGKVTIAETTLDYPAKRVCVSDEAVKAMLHEHLHEFEGPTGAKHLFGIVEFKDGMAAVTLYGDGYVHRQGLADYCDVIEEAEGRKEYSYSSGLVSLSNLAKHELLTVCIDHRLTLLRPTPECPDVNAVACWNQLLKAFHLIGQAGRGVLLYVMLEAGRFAGS